MSSAGVGTVGRPASIPDAPEPTIPAVDDSFGDSMWRGLIMVPVGCLLVALLCTGMLSRFAVASTLTSSAPAADSAVQSRLGVATFYEVEGASSLLRFDVALAR